MSYKLKPIAAEKIAEFKANNEFVHCKSFTLNTEDGEDVGDVFMKRPSAFVIGQVERFIDKESFKAREILIKGTVVFKEQQEEILSWEKNSDEYAAAFNAASQMLPSGKASVKKS